MVGRIELIPYLQHWQVERVSMKLSHFQFGNKTVYFYLDEYCDPCSQFIDNHQTFYELEYLEFLNYLPINNGIVVDIGAGIGNHALYCSLFLNKKVYALELNSKKYEILKTNIFLNNSSKNVFPIHSNPADKNIIFRQSVDKRLQNAIDYLDELIVDKNISYIKIDLNYCSQKVVTRLLESIKRSGPVIVFQYKMASQYSEVNEILSSKNYRAIHRTSPFGLNYAIFISLDKATESAIASLQNLASSLTFNLGECDETDFQNEMDLTEENSGLALADRVNWSANINDDVIKGLLQRAEYKEEYLKSSLSFFEDPVAAAELFLSKTELSCNNVLINLTGFTKNIGHYDHIQYLPNGDFLVNDVAYKNLKIPSPYNTILIRMLIQTFKKQNKNIFIITYADSNLKYAHEFFEQYGVNYGLILNDIPDIKWSHWAHLANASFITSFDSDIIERFKKQYIFPIRGINEIEWVFDRLIAPYKVNIVKSSKEKKRVLLISYYALDMDIVGVMRANYWFANVPHLSNGDIHIEMATAIKPHYAYNNVHYVPDFGIESATIINEVEFEKHLSISQYMNTMALSWTKELIKYFDGINAHYDVVIMTGNPFFHFEFSNYAKQRWGAQVYQDYRDPMAVNPRLLDEKQEFRQHHEDYFCSLADKVITVNQWCANNLSILAPQPIEVIPNGYNDVLFDSETVIRSQNDKFINDKFMNKPHSSKMAYLSRAKGRVVNSANTFLSQYEKLRKKPWLENIQKRFDILNVATSDASALKAKKIISQLDGMVKLYSRNDRVIRLVYAGTFYAAANPTNLINAVKSVIGYELHHFGSESKYMKTKNARITSHGRVSHAEVFDSLQYLDIGVVFVSHDFESTTKIYDYIARDMPILVITALDNPRPLSLYQELEGLEGVYWVVNDKEAITAFLKDYVHRPIQRTRKHEYSREYGTKRLIKLILDGE